MTPNNKNVRNGLLLICVLGLLVYITGCHVISLQTGNFSLSPARHFA